MFHYPNYTTFKDHFTNIKSISSLNQRLLCYKINATTYQTFPLPTSFSKPRNAKNISSMYIYILIYFDKLFLKEMNYFSLINIELRVKWKFLQTRNNYKKYFRKTRYSFKSLRKNSLIIIKSTLTIRILKLKRYQFKKVKKIWRMMPSSSWYAKFLN